MFKFIACFAFIATAIAAPGHLVETHSVLQPAVVAKTAIVDNSASSAITHQSFTNLVHKVPVAPVVQTYAAPAHVVKTVSAPVVHSAPVLHSIHAAPLVHSVQSAPVVHSIHSAPVVHSAPLLHSSPVVHTYAAAPVVHSAPLIKSVVSAPVSYTLHH